MAHLEERMTLDYGVVSSSPMWGVETTGRKEDFKKKKKDLASNWKQGYAFLLLPKDRGLWEVSSTGRIKKPPGQRHREIG